MHKRDQRGHTKYYMLVIFALLTMEPMRILITDPYCHKFFSHSIITGGGGNLVLRRQPRPQFLMWYKTINWLFGSHVNLLTRQ